MAAPAPVVGKIVAFEGDADIQTSSGGKLPAAGGVDVHLHDRITTGPASSVEIEFVDGTRFAIAPNSEMTITKLVYDPDGTDNGLFIDFFQGAFEFVAGAVAPLFGDGMQVATPAGTLGVRGTAAAGSQDPITGTWSFLLLEDPNGHVGKIMLVNNAGEVLLDQALESTRIVDGGTSPSEPVSLTPAQVRDMFGAAAGLIDELEKQLGGAAGDQGSNAPGAPSPSAIETASAHGVTQHMEFSEGVPLGAAPTQMAEGAPRAAGVLLETAILEDQKFLNEMLAVIAGDDDSDVLPMPGDEPVSPPPPPPPPYNYIYDTSGNDTVAGTAGTDWFISSGGQDTILGSPGDDRFEAIAPIVDYSASPSGIHVDVAAKIILDGYGTTDVGIGFTWFQTVYGSDFDDIMDERGFSGMGEFHGGAGNDTFFGGENSNRFDGGQGDDHFVGNAAAHTNMADYFDAPSGIQVDLSANLASDDGYGGQDTLVLVNTVSGSQFNDSIAGDASDNTLYGRAGNDTLVGGGGVDHLNGEEGNDTLVLTDWLNGSYAIGRAGTDTLSVGASAGAAFNLTAANASGHFMEIERVALDGTGANSLTLNVNDVLDLSDTNSLVIFGGFDDSVSSSGQGWAGAGTTTIDGQLMNVYTAGGAMLYVDQDIVQNIS